MVDRKDRIRSIQKYGKTAQGRQELLRHVEGERLTLRQMVLAMCYECMAYYGDGKTDCKIPLCPLYPMMPFKKGEKYRVFAKKEKSVARKSRQDKDFHEDALEAAPEPSPAKSSKRARSTHSPRAERKAKTA